MASNAQLKKLRPISMLQELVWIRRHQIKGSSDYIQFWAYTLCKMQFHYVHICMCVYYFYPYTVNCIVYYFLAKLKMQFHYVHLCVYYFHPYTLNCRVYYLLARLEKSSSIIQNYLLKNLKKLALPAILSSKITLQTVMPCKTNCILWQINTYTYNFVSLPLIFQEIFCSRFIIILYILKLLTKYFKIQQTNKKQQHFQRHCIEDENPSMSGHVKLDTKTKSIKMSDHTELDTRSIKRIQRKALRHEALCAGTLQVTHIFCIKFMHTNIMCTFICTYISLQLQFTHILQEIFAITHILQEIIAIIYMQEIFASIHILQEIFAIIHILQESVQLKQTTLYMLMIILIIIRKLSKTLNVLNF